MFLLPGPRRRWTLDAYHVLTALRLRLPADHRRKHIMATCCIGVGESWTSIAERFVLLPALALCKAVKRCEEVGQCRG